MREAIYPSTKIYFDTIRERRAEDSLQKLLSQKEVAAVIKERDEF